MLSLVQAINGAFSVLLYFINTVFWVIPIVLLSFLKVIPIKLWRSGISYILDGCATAWISVNNINQKIFSRTKINTIGLEQLALKDWYLVIANHQSWVDILVLQRIFNRKIPFLKFFLKQELIWVPFLGIAWWALDFPFMRRYNKSYLAKHPHLKGKDLETTKQACEKFRYKPVSIMNFVEGTRYTADKKSQKKSQFNHLLNPKAGGISFVLHAMGNQLHKVVDVTIHYPNGIPTYWDFVAGKVPNINVEVKTVLIEDLFANGIFSEDYFDSKDQRVKFQKWLNGVWHDKDERLAELNKIIAK